MYRMAVLAVVMGFVSNTGWAKESRAPSVNLRVEGKLLQYEYDLSGLFDATLWSVLEKNQDNLITIEVRLLDSANRVRIKQYHRIQLVVLKGGAVRVTSDGIRSKTYTNRERLARALQKVSGKPILASQFSGQQGFLEIVALVNPYAVYSFPKTDKAIARGTVIPRTYFDRKLQLRSSPISTPR